MHLVFSALQSQPKTSSHPAAARHYGYIAACRKHRDMIAIIQEYFPGWMPALPHPSAVHSHTLTAL